MTDDKKLLFGTGGTPHSSKSKSTAAGIERIAELGLGCMEVEFVYGANMTEQMAIEVGKLAKKLGVKLTAHAPYYINLNAHDEKKLIDSQKRLMQTARIASLIGAEGIVFHPAFYLKDSPDETYKKVKSELKKTVESLRGEGIQTLLLAETTGKATQFGTLEEILRLSVEVDGVAPCIDFAHMHAKTGANNSYSEFVHILNRTAERLGWHALEHLHIHLSGIKYGSKGELSHLDLKDSDLRYADLLLALKDLDVKGTVICESPNLEADALMLQKTFQSM